ncbi:MAG: hypothetical protein ACI8SJ_001783, partial [Shewanella sp.]
VNRCPNTNAALKDDFKRRVLHFFTAIAAAKNLYVK